MMSEHSQRRQEGWVSGSNNRKMCLCPQGSRNIHIVHTCHLIKNLCRTFKEAFWDKKRGIQMNNGTHNENDVRTVTVMSRKTEFLTNPKNVCVVDCMGFGKIHPTRGPCFKPSLFFYCRVINCESEINIFVIPPKMMQDSQPHNGYIQLEGETTKGSTHKN